MRLNGTFKFVSTLVSSLLVVVLLIFATMRYTQSQMGAFCNDYDERLRTVENDRTEIKVDIKYIRESIQRIENKLD